MSSHPLKKQTSLIMAGLLVAGVSASNLRETHNNNLFKDPNCNQYSADGSCCVKCSFRFYKNEHGVCTKVSDWCKTWSRKTGCCTSCFVGYGEPVNGVCASGPAVICSQERLSMCSVDDHSEEKIVVEKCRDDSSKAKSDKKRYGSKTNRSRSNRSKKSRKSNCSQEKKSKNHGKDCASCRKNYGVGEGKWKNVDRLGYKQNGVFGHTVGGKIAEKISQRSERKSKWFSKKTKCEKEVPKKPDCEQSTKEIKKERSCSKKSNRSLSKKTNKSVGKKSCRSLSKKSPIKKPDCKSPEKKSQRSCSRKSNKSNKSKKPDCKSVEKKECRSLSKKSPIKKPDCKTPEKKSNVSNKKNNCEGVSMRVEVTSKREGVTMRVEVNSQAKKVVKKEGASLKKWETASKKIVSKGKC